MLKFTKIAPRSCPWDLDTIVGIIPLFLDPRDERCAAEQLDANYAHGEGWNPMPKWTLRSHDNALQYPGDPSLLSLAAATLRNETILVYQSGITAIVQTNGAFEVSRLD